MPRCLDSLQKLFPRKAAVIVLLLVTAGCVSSRADDGSALKEAQAARAAAVSRFAKAVTRFCSVTTETLIARDACLRDQLAWLYVEQSASLTQEFPASARSPINVQSP